MSIRIRLGLLRLVDSAPVVVAQERGLFEAFGLSVDLSVEPSWSNIADKLAYGLLDAAVMLPPLALACNVGLRGPRTDLIVPLGLSQCGNTLVLGGLEPRDGGPEASPGGKLAAWMRRRQGKPRIAVVHRFSTHNLLMRYWLALTGVDPDTAIETVVVPPDQVVEALLTGAIAGFCAGAPWGQAAELAGAGSILLGTSEIWPFHPEKCLGVRRKWAEADDKALIGLLRALMRGQAICDQAGEADAVAALLARPDTLSLPPVATRAALPGGTGREQVHFHRAIAGLPSPAHAAWFLRQMRRWGWIATDAAETEAARLYRPDVFGRAACVEQVFVSSGTGPDATAPRSASH